MNTPTNVVHLRQPEELEDPLTDILRSGARRLLAQAVELEAETFLAGMQALKLPDGRDRLVRHGYGPERMIQTGIGPVTTGSASHRPVGAPLSLRLGRRRLPAGPDGGACRMHAGHHRRDARGREGVGGLPGWCPGERSELA